MVMISKGKGEKESAVISVEAVVTEIMICQTEKQIWCEAVNVNMTEFCDQFSRCTEYSFRRASAQ